MIVVVVVGGVIVVNGMGCDCGSKVDYDVWEELGNLGWGWNGLLFYFKKSIIFIFFNFDVVDWWNIIWNIVVYGKGFV